MGSSDLRLPVHLGLAEDLSRGLELHAAVEEDSADDDGVWAHYFLVVVCVRYKTTLVSCHIVLPTMYRDRGMDGCRM